MAVKRNNYSLTLIRSLRKVQLFNIPMRKRSLFFLFVCILLNSCNGSIPDNDDIPDQPKPKKINRQKLLELVNNYRQSGCNCGGENMPPVNPVVWNDQLEKAAQKHSDDMKSNNFFSHTGSDGKNAGNRITNAGYVWTTYGENIGSGYKTEEAVVNGWINSGGHCKNIMNAGFKDMGVAVSGDYWTQVFGRKQ